ncbi:MAG TPA: hypothetical protein VET23_00920 [Chitinophagaceae bacterium]|nr:hypothetical protein [Chitinophagaceae bacterium]
MKRTSRLRRIILLVVLIAPLAIFIFGSIVMLLWNNVLSPVLHVSTITFWQGLGILVLSKILFSSFNGRGGAPRRVFMKQRMMWNSMTPEQKEKFKEEWRNRCGRPGYRSWDSETEVSQPGMGA